MIGNAHLIVSAMRFTAALPICVKRRRFQSFSQQNSLAAELL
jgi:hypothetical protein